MRRYTEPGEAGDTVAILAAGILMAAAALLGLAVVLAWKGWILG